MRTSRHSLNRSLRATALGLVLCAHLLPAAEIDLPDAWAVITSRQGSIHITDESGTLPAPKLHDARTLSGQTIRTEKGAHIFFALSNGLGIGIGEDSQITFQTYGQKPFLPKNENLDYEPSISTLTVEIQRGRFAIESDGLSPRSEARLLTPNGALRVHSANCLIEVRETGTIITVYQGNTTFYYPDGKNRDFFSGLASVRISPQSAAMGKLAEQIDVASLDEASQRFAEAARHASQRVFFRAPQTGQTPIPVLIAPTSYFEQTPLRPYEFSE